MRITQTWTFLLALLFTLNCSSGAIAEVRLECETLPRLMHTYLKDHISFHHLSGELQERTVENYLRRIDPSKMLLLESEAEALRHTLRSIFTEMRFGNCDALSSIQRDIVRRHREVQKEVSEIVSAPKFGVDLTTELILDPEKRGFPKTVEERSELLVRLANFQISNYESAGTELAEAKEKLSHRYELFTKRAEEVDGEDLYSRFLDAFATALDPHSSFFSRDDLEDFRISMGLSLEGIGVALTSRDGYSIVQEIIPGGATDRGDLLKPQDKIIAVAQDGKEPVSIIDMSLRDVVRLIRGKKGSKVHLTVLRQDETTERFSVTIVRDKIDLKEQAANLRFEERAVDGKKLKLAVLDLPSFYGDGDPRNRNSARDVEKLLKQVEIEGADGLLLDLSRNGGGLLEEAINITGFFLRTGGVVAVQDAGQAPIIRRDEDRRILYKGPLVVLISRMSASASEILAGAVKDYQRAVIVGDDHTFGKGTVQNVVSLPAGIGALKITMAMFFRPGGASTQHDGVASGVPIPSIFNIDDIGEKTQEYSLTSRRIQPFISDDANALLSANRWKPVPPEAVTKLALRSAERVEGEEKFQEIRERLAKRAEASDVVVLGELLKDREELEAEENGHGEETAKEDAEDDPEKEKELTPQAEEALNILADLAVELSSQSK